MRRILLILGLCLLFSVDCRAAGPVDDFRDAVAVDLAVATMAGNPAPPQPGPPQPYRCPRCEDTGWITHGDGHRTPCPDCRDETGGPYGGPLDTLRDAKELIRKGNQLADRGKELLDAAQRDGKITVDVRLPQPNAPRSVPTKESTCPGGVCPLVPKQTKPSQPRLFGRWRR